MMGLPVGCSRLARAPGGPISSGRLPGRRDVRPHARTVGRNGRWNQRRAFPPSADRYASTLSSRGTAWTIAEQAGAVFVGRQRELGALLEGLESAVAGRGRLILVGGEPGIGKSRLADELAGMARDRGIGVLWGRGWEDAGAPAYWPWVQALRTLLRTVTPEAIRGYLGSGAADVAQILPELRTIVPELPSRSPDSDAARFQLFDSTADFIRNAARERPILIVLDDLQAADTPSILLLQFLASQLSDMRLLIVGTYRDVELTPEHPLTSAIAEIAREPSVRVIALRGLEAEAVAEVIGAAAGTAPTGRVAAAVWRATNGNPLFVGEAIRLLSAEGRLDDIGGADELRVAIPAGVHAVIARRIGYLGGPDDRRAAPRVGPRARVQPGCACADRRQRRRPGARRDRRSDRGRPPAAGGRWPWSLSVLA